MTDIVEAQWRKLLTTAGEPEPPVASPLLTPFRELLREAYAEPRLRRLFPWTGMWELHFSRCTEQRWTWDIPYAAPAKGGGYLVAGPSRSEVVGPADTAGDAVAMVVERLPPGCGPAFVGTPEELAAYERNQDTG